ncbi:MAG: hypothetical protein JWL62_2600, partial [Hyphomicrobiales bacterium]|nr:hypothetical protein [Hyphomicrobiales bacterium]
ASPRLDENNILHLAGYYNTSPERVTFDITIAPVNNVWRLGSISVKVLPPPSVAQAPPAPRPATAPITKKKSPGHDSKEAVTKAR